MDNGSVVSTDRHQSYTTSSTNDEPFGGFPTVKDSEQELIETPAPIQQLSLDSKAAYILTGGLGGLGRSIATWLVEHGACNLVFLSRTAGSKIEDLRFVQELESLGCSAFPVAGEAQNMDDVQRAVAAPGCRIKGVIHLAGILRVWYTNSQIPMRVMLTFYTCRILPSSK